MKVSVYTGGNYSVDVNFRHAGEPEIIKDGVISFSGYHTHNSTESKATIELTFDEALDFIERLKHAVASMPCPCCGRKV